MTATLPIPTRLLLLIGVAALAGLAFLVARPLLLSDDSTSPNTAYPSTPTKPSTSAQTPAKPAAPKVHLLAGIPKPIASKLMHSRVVIVSVYAGTAEGDRAAVASARAGAKDAGVGFATVNVLDDKRAQELQAFAGTVNTPTMLVVKRPGRVITRLDGPVDAKLVAQAGLNARKNGK